MRAVLGPNGACEPWAHGPDLRDEDEPEDDPHRGEDDWEDFDAFGDLDLGADKQ